MNGANSNGKNYQPDVTSYDYDAPLDEAGHPTPKYLRLPRRHRARHRRQTAARSSAASRHHHSGVHARPLRLALAQPAQARPLREAPHHGRWTRPTATSSTAPPSAGPVSGDLVLGALHDYAQVYVNGKLAGTLDRRLEPNLTPAPHRERSTRASTSSSRTPAASTSARLFPASAWVCSKASPSPASRSPAGKSTRCPCSHPDTLPFTNKPCTGPCFYTATFNVSHPADTFLDTSALGKGLVWINGHPLGRFWHIGPQKTLYLPAPWLKAGTNQVVVFDLEGQPGRQLQGLDHPVLNAPIENP